MSNPPTDQWQYRNHSPDRKEKMLRHVFKLHVPTLFDHLPNQTEKQKNRVKNLSPAQIPNLQDLSSYEVSNLIEWFGANKERLRSWTYAILAEQQEKFDGVNTTFTYYVDFLKL